MHIASLFRLAMEAEELQTRILEAELPDLGRPDIAECWISRGLSEKSRLKAALELNESAEKQSSALEELRQLLNAYEKSHPDLVFSRRDDRFLRMFLRSRKYDVPQAMKLLKKYLKFHAKNRELYEDITFESVRKVLESRVILALPERDYQGRRILVICVAGLWQDMAPTPIEWNRAMVYVLDALLEDEETQVNGILMLADYSGMTMSRFTKHEDQSKLQQMTELLFGTAYPFDLQGFHIFNEPWFFHIHISRAKSVMPPSGKKHIHAYGPMIEDLFMTVPKTILPAEFGGDGPSYDLEGFLDFLSKVKLRRTLLSSSAAV